MTMEIGFKKWNRYWMGGLSVVSPFALFWDSKNSPGFVQIGPKTSMCWVLEIDEMNDLSCIGISRLMHKLCVLT